MKGEVCSFCGGAPVVSVRRDVVRYPGFYFHSPPRLVPMEERYYCAGCSGSPRSSSDPEYSEYLRLKAKFEAP